MKAIEKQNAGEISLNSKTSLKDGTITLLYHSGEDYEQEEEVTMYVEHEKITE